MLSVDSCLESVFFQNLYQYGLCTLVYLYLSVYAELCQYGAGRQPFHADIPRQGLAEEDEGGSGESGNDGDENENPLG